MAALSDKKEIVSICKHSEKIYIYGAGRNAIRITEFLKKENIKIDGFVVSYMDNNPKVLFGLPVIEIKDLNKGLEDLIIVSIGKDSAAYKQIFEMLVASQKEHVIFLPMGFLKKLKTESFEQRLKDFFEVGIYHLGNDIPVELEHNILVMKNDKGEDYHWRLKSTILESSNCASILELFSEKTALEEFEEKYGRYHKLQLLKQNLTVVKTCGIYMAKTCIDKEVMQGPLLPWIIPIQVGTVFTEQRISQICDNQGDNISERNGIYSECTALYWMWKHAPRTDYIGLCHYRRHFDMTEEDLGKLSDNDIDVLVTTPTFVYEGIGNFFATLTPKTDIDMLLKAISQVQPEYFETAQSFLQSRFFPPCNLSLMKYELFQEYAEFVFSITFKVEEFYDSMGFYRKDRYMGYLVECLLGIFLMYNKERLKIAYTDMIFYT